MSNWIHKLFNPHCTECNVCNSCEMLKTQINILNSTNSDLIKQIVFLTTPKSVETQPLPDNDTKPIQTTKHMPWRMKQAMLEAEDRVKAEVLKQRENEIAAAEKSTEELEKELGLNTLKEVNG